MSTTQKAKRAPASAFVKATKIDRQRFLDEWALENPDATIEEARVALRHRFEGIAMGTKAISDTLRMSKSLWEDQRKQIRVSGGTLVAAVAPQTSAQAQITILAHAMELAGVRLLERHPDGTLRVEIDPLSDLRGGGSHVGDDHGPEMDNAGL